MVKNCFRSVRLSLFALAATSYLLSCLSPVLADELPRTGVFGVQVDETTTDKNSLGVKVQAIALQTAVEAAGIRPGDMILKINGKEIRTATEFLSQRLQSGSQVELVLLRDGKQVVNRFAIQSRPDEKHPDFDILYKTVVVDNTRRRAIVTKPRAAQKFPAILIVTGVGCFSQEFPSNSPFAQLPYGLTKGGFVTMRVEKSGVGDSEGLPCDDPRVDLQAELRGYIAGLKALKNYDFVNPDKVFLLGLSIGGVEAPLIAKQVPVKGIIVAETVGKSWYEYELENYRRQELLQGKAYDEVERKVRQLNYCNQKLYVRKETPQQIQQDEPNCLNLYAYTKIPVPYTYMQQVANLNLAEVWQPINVPVLVMYGKADFLTSLSEHEYLANTINSFHPGQATLSVIDDVDHWFIRTASQQTSYQRAESEKIFEGEFHPAVLTTMLKWLSASF